MVFCGLFPIDTDRYEDCRTHSTRWAWNDAALSWEPRLPRRWDSASAWFSGCFTWRSCARGWSANTTPRADGDQPDRALRVHTTNGEMTEISSPNRCRPRFDRTDRRALHPSHCQYPTEYVGGDGALPVAARYP